MSTPGLQAPTLAQNASLWHVATEAFKLIVDSALTKTTSIAQTSGTYNVTSADDANDEGKALRLKATGALVGDLTIVVQSKPRLWVLSNATSGSSLCIFKVGTDLYAVAQGKSVLVYTDGTTWTPIGDFSIADGSITTAKLADDAVTGAKIADATIPNASLIDDSIEYAKLSAACKAAILAAVAGATAISSSFTSSSLSFASQSVAHGLGGAPKIVEMDFVCISADLGYSVGDVVPWAISGGGLWFNATNIGVAISTGPYSIIDKSSGNGSTLTKAKWNIVLKAFK